MKEDQGGSRVFIVGGAGFVGSHFVDYLLGQKVTDAVTVYDNFSSGRRWHVAHHQADRRLRVIEGDVQNDDLLTSTMSGHDTVIHLASNPDIARAVSEPKIDFDQGTLLTQQVLEAARQTGTTMVLYASGSGVYGELGEYAPEESHGPLVPVSTYGASKLAGEALLSAYCAMFGLVGIAFRFANVVGARQTHGVAYDFVGRLLRNPDVLNVLGNGHQSKSYIHVSDVVAGVMMAAEHPPATFDVYNIATRDYVSVRAIAQMTLEELGLDESSTKTRYTSDDRGWNGDVPVVRLDSSKMRGLGWSNRMTSADALRAAIREIVAERRREHGA